VRPGALGVREVVAPHEVADADLVATRASSRRRAPARADVCSKLRSSSCGRSRRLVASTGCRRAARRASADFEGVVIHRRDRPPDASLTGCIDASGAQMNPVRSTGDGEEPPASRNAFEFVVASIVEIDS
jgi:hypothetical protein